MSKFKTVKTPVLDIAYYDHGPATGWPVVLSHGFPFAPQAYDEVVPLLTKHGARVIVPYLRGYGPTRFLNPTTTRAAQQAALGSDLLALLDALDTPKPIVAGFDWGGVSSCVVAALWPERVAGLVSYAGYDIVDRAAQRRALDPRLESVCWYQHLFQSERGRECLAESRRELCRLLWQQWMATSIDEPVFNRMAESWDNPDFVDVVVGTYRHVLGSEDGDPALGGLEERLAARPKIAVPAVTLDGAMDPLKPGGSASHRDMFTGRYELRVYDVGHAFPLEAPAAFADAVLTVREWSRE